MKEELLHYIWKTKNFSMSNLITEDKQNLEVKNFGFHNEHSGPDFLQAQIKIADTWWFGHAEIHIKSSDWYAHKHQEDPGYENVILHIVYEHDQEVYRKDGTKIPCLVLKDRISNYLVESYYQIINQQSWVPCAYYMDEGSLVEFYFQRHKLFIERLEQKSIELLSEFNRNGKNWDQLLWYSICKSFGLKVNADAMTELALKVPIRLLFKHAFNPIQLESILFGQAGMLPQKSEFEYVGKLRSEYQFLKKKYQMTPMKGREWKYMRLRPNSFPTIRIAQLANLYSKGSQLHQQIHTADSVHDVYRALEGTAGEFWNDHYTLYKSSDHHTTKQISKRMKELVVINAVIPYIFTMGQVNSDDSLTEKAMQWAQELPPESNKIIRKWKSIGIEVENAYDSQAMIHLKNMYCNQKKCLECRHGHKIVTTISHQLEEATEKISA